MKQQTLSDLLGGSRIILKKHDESLATRMFSAIEKDRDRLGVFLPWVPHIKVEQDELAWIKTTHKMWNESTMFDYGIFLKDDDSYLGNIGVHNIRWDVPRCEIGYWIVGDYEGRGYMSEALRILEAHLFEKGVHRIEVHCSSNNLKSSRVPNSCGYYFDGLLKENSLEQSQIRDTFIFSKLASQYQKDNIQPLTVMDKLNVLKIAQELPDFFTEKGISAINADLENQNGLIYRHQDQVVGFLMYFSYQANLQIGWMGILPKYQDQGFGKKLLQALKNQGLQSGCHSMMVNTLDESVEYKPYEKTRAFYLKNGFKKFQVVQHPDNPECEAELILKMEI